ncbi:hypothetical protein SG0102_12320 [Intestinibaculum porci]|uniref:Uncharacterized protein n=1 Tax=Intestinibaculum porci TaxID=2487118 RepID=A0A3G9JPW9_9FIRM|nr:hypothetical protein [Intestinibaculum porci]BBH26298.1 hypothetical protein SG0102_12320 [Intestinibaculum porci]
MLKEIAGAPIMDIVTAKKVDDIKNKVFKKELENRLFNDDYHRQQDLNEIGKDKIIENQEMNELKGKSENLLFNRRKFLDHLFPEDRADAKEVKVTIEQDSLENKEVSEQERSPEEIDQLQRKAIAEAFKKIFRGEKLTDAEKGNLGEMLMDQYYIARGYRPIHKDRVVDLEHKSGQGIDGAYEKEDANGKKVYVIVDAKVNSSRLNKGLADGTDQMSDEWVVKRLEKAVGKKKADEILDAYEDDPQSIRKELYHFSYGNSPDGMSKADVSTVDAEGNLNKDKTIVQRFDENGNEIRGNSYDER